MKDFFSLYLKISSLIILIMLAMYSNAQHLSFLKSTNGHITRFKLPHKALLKTTNDPESFYNKVLIEKYSNDTLYVRNPEDKTMSKTISVNEITQIIMPRMVLHNVIRIGITIFLSAAVLSSLGEKNPAINVPVFAGFCSGVIILINATGPKRHFDMAKYHLQYSPK